MLYVGTPNREDTTPTADLTIHKDAHVYLKTNGTTNEVVAAIAGRDLRTHGKTLVFEYTGSGAPRSRDPSPPVNPQPPAVQTRSITVTASPSPAAPGNTVTVIASLSDNASGISVTFGTTTSGVIFSTPAPTTAGNTQSQFIVPSGVSSLTITAAAGNYLGGSITIGVSGTAEPAEEPEVTVLEPASIEIYDGDEQQGEINRRLAEDLVVEVIDRNNRGVSFEIVNLRVVEGSGRFSPTRPRTDANGRASFSFTPRSPGSQGTIEIEASVGDLSPATFIVNIGEPPDAIVKISGDNQSGRPGATLANPLVVEVIDANDDPVSGVTVNFAVTAGGGSVSPASATTNNNGRAQTRLTLGDEPGDNRVAARVSGLTAVNFTAKSGMVVLVGASQRAPMYWISRTDGTLYRLVDADIEALAPNLTGVTGITVDTANNTLYLAVQTGKNRGEIRSANLNGRNVQVLKTLTAVPMGITVDSAGGVVYWTNSRGRIQSIPTSGSTKLTNVVQNLSSPGPIVISNGHLYWGEATGRIGRIDLTATRQTIQNVATGLSEPLSLAIAKNKLYWVERSGGGSGGLNRSNLDGSNAQTLKTFASGVPTSIAVDGSDNKIYWTKGTGKIQRSNLAGRFVKDIATGVMSPTGIALNVAASDTVVRQPTQPTQPTTYSQYDVNQDGAVNNADTKLVSQVITGVTTNARADVDGSGTVDVTDLILIIANLDDDVAAPTLDVDVKSLDVDFDRVQEQVEALLASGDRSIAAQRALLYLQHLLASARPDETVLLANYPNPFNPETWIPYHLSESTDVKVNIYDSQGVLVRALTLGHQSAGYYTSRSRAAYWDGRNAFGERVASGIYFYQLQTDEMSPLRKMVILK